MNRFKKSMPIATAFTLHILLAAPALIAAPSKEVTDQLIAELQGIRKSLARDSIEIFETHEKLADMPTPPDQPWWNKETATRDWHKEKLCRAIVNEENPVTDFDLLVDDIGRIAGSLKGIAHYTYSQMAERILRLQLYCNRFAHSAIPYIDACDPHHHLITECRNTLDESASEERTFRGKRTRTITSSDRIKIEDWLDTTMYRFSGCLPCMPQTNPAPATQASPPATQSYKRTISDENEKITKDPKRMHLNEEEDSDNDTQALQPVAQSIPKKPGLLALLRSHAHDTNTIRKRSNLMAHDAFRDHLLKMESQAIVDTLPCQTPIREKNGVICANNYEEALDLHSVCSRLRESLSDAKKITPSGSFMLSTAQKISSCVSDLEANHVNTYAQNIARIKDWQQHYQNVLNMGCLYLKGITVKEPDHIALYDQLKNRFANDLGVDVIPTLPPENPESTDIQKILDLQRITLANKTTHALANLKKMQNMLDAEQKDNGRASEDDDDNGE